MISEEMLIARLRDLSDTERSQLLSKIEIWFEQIDVNKTTSIERALAAVERTWATINMRPDLVRWFAESKDLEYDVR